MLSLRRGAVGVVAVLLVSGVASAQTSAELAATRVEADAGDLESQVLASRARLAALGAPLPAPYQCPTPAPKSEFEPTVAFDARLASAQQACTDGTCQGEQALQAERTRRVSLTDTPLTLPLWNTTAQYDADREVFLVNLLEGPDDREWRSEGLSYRACATQVAEQFGITMDASTIHRMLGGKRKTDALVAA